MENGDGFSYNKKQLTHSLEDYLETMYIMEKTKGVCRITDVSEQMLKSKASVNKAVKQLKQLNLVTQEKYSAITLTKIGKEIAESVYSKHKILFKFLKDVLSVPLEVAEDEACKIEHVISSDTLKKLKKYCQSNT